MYFLGSLYRYLLSHLAPHINHFPLVKLFVISLDHALFLFLFYLLYRLMRNLYRVKIKKQPFDKPRELRLGLLVFYLILLFLLTAFRNRWGMTAFRLNIQPLNAINLHLLTESLKLRQGASQVDFYYNIVGNMFWFIPIGYLYPFLTRQKPQFWKTFILATLLSLSIETLQFLLGTGISDIDDIIFNVIGALIGHFLYQIWRWIRNHRKEHKHAENKA